MKKALIVIDFNNDFVADDGKLTCGAVAQAIDEKIASLVEEFAKNGDFIVNACDNHVENDLYSIEKDMFPAHCFDDYGKDLYGKTKIAVEKVEKNQYLYIAKNRFSAFAGTPLDLKLKERGVNDIILVGVCTDICVLHCAVDAYNLGYKISIVRDGVASFNQVGHDFALSHFENTLGAKII
ncbi:MAG: isochorismatase family cysteine hydrolase [Clostridia bacterium]